MSLEFASGLIKFPEETLFEPSCLVAVAWPFSLLDTGFLFVSTTGDEPGLVRGVGGGTSFRAGSRLAMDLEG